MGAHVEADRVGELDGPHRHAEGARRLVDLLLGLAALEPLQRLHHVGAQHAVDEEARTALDDQRELVDGGHEDAALAHLVLAALGAADHLDQRHLRHRIEEVDADETAGIGQRRGDLLDHDRGGVGGEDGAGLELALERLEEVLLDLELLDDRLDHHVGAADALARRVGDQARHGRRALRLAS